MKKICLTIMVIFWVALMQTLWAVPARPGWQTKTQPDGTTIEVELRGDEFLHYWANRDGQVVQCDENGFWQVLTEKPALSSKAAKRNATKKLVRPIAKASVSGSPRGLVVLVNFKDEAFQAVNSQSAMDDMMNGENYNYNGATGSVGKYFSDQSNGQYTPVFDVVGPVTLPYNMSHYGGNDEDEQDLLPGDMVVEACSIANALHNVDFTRYDNDHDGYVDFIYVIYAGQSEAAGGSPNTIWPHAWDLYSAERGGYCSYGESKRQFDGKYIYKYACSAELNYDKERDGVGTFAHEFSHVIGLPDVYDIDYGSNYEEKMTPGYWHLMDGGSYNNGGKTPPNYTFYDKYFLGWVTPKNPGNTAQELLIKANEGYQIASSNSLLSATSTNTVYYIENRQQSGWDAALPGHGLLIWQVQYNNAAWNSNGPNDQDGTLRYTIVSASGKTTNLGTKADPFPGSQGKTEWRGISSKPLLNITEIDGVITLNYIEIPDENSWKYEVLYENATVSSELGKVAKGGTLTLTVKPAKGYLLDETMIEVEENDTARSFTYSNNTLTIKNVQGDLGIYVMPEADPNEPDTPDTSTEEIVFIPADFTATTSTEIDLQKSKVSIHCSSGTVNADQFRFFKDQTLTISASGAVITSIEFTCESNYGPSGFTTATGYTSSGNVGTWQGNATFVEFKASKKQVRATKIVVTIAGEGSGDTPNNPDEPTIAAEITGLREADAIYVTDAEYGDYWVFDMFAGYDYDDMDYIYPELYVMVNEAYGKTTLNGTYKILYTEYFPNASSAGIYTDEYAEDFVGTLTIQNTDNNGNYSFKGSFTATDGQTYTFNQVLKVTASEYFYDETTGESSYGDLTLSETDSPDTPDNPGEPNDPNTPDTPGETITIIFDADVDQGNAGTDSKNAVAYQVTKDGVTLDVSSGILGKYNNEMHYRIYQDQTLTLTSTIGDITKVEFACTATGTAKYGPGNFKVDDGSYTYSGSTGTWTGNAASVVFTAATAQVRATQIVVHIAKQSIATSTEHLTTQPTASKILHNGQIVILRDGKIYTIMGQQLQTL